LSATFTVTREGAFLKAQDVSDNEMARAVPNESFKRCLPAAESFAVNFFRQSLAVISNAHQYPFRLLVNFDSRAIAIRVTIHICQPFLNDPENRHFHFF
jgi:hypothetical protein